MSIMLMKKKKYRFQVDCTAEELTAVSYLNAILFAKLRLLEGGTFSEESPRLEVKEHSVRWHKTFSFQCKMTANASTGVLDPCHCRISVRREAQGGKSCIKLGFVDLNLANFAGKGTVTQRFLLEGYRQNHRQDNSILRVSVNLTLLAGDPCFKLFDGTAVAESEGLSAQGSHIPQDGNSPSPDSSPMQPNRGLPPSTDDDYCSLPRRQQHLDGGSSGGSSADTPPPSGLNLLLLERTESFPHTVSESGAGLHSNEYGYYGANGCPAGSGMHQRQISNDSGSGHLRNPSSGSSHCDTGSLKDRSKRNSQRNPLNVVDERNPKMDSTRQDPNYLIDQLLLSSKLSPSLSVGEVACPSPVGGLSSGPDSGVGIEHDSESECTGFRHFGLGNRDTAISTKDYH